jgi:diguanylate cyclase (GGDEF)-like protein
MHGDDAYVIEALRAGAKGYVLKENGADDLVKAVRSVAATRIFLSEPLDERMAKICSAANVFDDGTCREILSLRSAGMKQKSTVKDEPAPSLREERIQLGSENLDDSTVKASLEKRVQALQEQALMDELTGVGNRRYANISLDTKIDELRRYNWLFGIVFFDLDNFKQINDVYGHEAGDRVLQFIASEVSKAVQSYNSFFFRWGGDEFLIIASNVNAGQLFDLGEQVRLQVANSPVPLGSENIWISISVGTTLAKPEDNRDGLMRRVDEMLYISK